MNYLNFLLCAVIVVQSAALVWLVDRVTRRHDTQVQELCQRLQAPEVAVAQHADYTPDGEEFPMNDDDLAEQEERARVLAFIDRHENGGER